MRFGFHISIAQGFTRSIERALALGCETMQIFTASQLRWKRTPFDEDEIAEFRLALDKSGISPLVVHLFYLPNLASPDRKLLERSRDALVDELNRAAVLGADYLVLHPGAYKESNADEGIRKVATSLDYAIAKTAGHDGDRVKILIENTAGGGTRLGSEFQELAEIFDRIIQDYRVGVCIDTSHAFQTGYPIDTSAGLEQTLEEFDKLIGLEKLHLLHLNDSKTKRGSRNDRHWNIGEGEIGLEALQKIINHPKLSHLPAILETPSSPENDARNMKVVKKLRNN